MHHPIDIAHPDILPLRAHGNQKIETGDRRSACAGSNDLDVRELLAVQQQRVADRRADDNGGAMLIVMKYRDLHPLFELRLDLETARRLRRYEFMVTFAPLPVEGGTGSPVNPLAIF